MPRREFPAKVKAQAFARCGGRCEGCTAKLMTGKIEYDHDIPDGLGGEPILANCKVLCRSCHSVKTSSEDVPRIAKAKRVHRRHVGIRKRSSFLTSKAGPFKKKLNGEVVRRHP